MALSPKCRWETNTPDASLAHPAHSSLSSDFLELFTSKDDADVTFVCSDGEIKAHKLIVFARVPHFKTMISSGDKAKGRKRKLNLMDRIQVPDADVESFDIFLRFIYGGQLPEEFGVEQQLKFATAFEVNGLVSSCIPKLRRDLAEKDVLNCAQDALRMMDACPFPEIPHVFETEIQNRLGSRFKWSSKWSDQRKLDMVEQIVVALRLSDVENLSSLKAICIERLGLILSRESSELLKPATKRLEGYPDLLLEMSSRYRVN